MTCNKVINLESLRSKKRPDLSLSEKSLGLKTIAPHQSQVEGGQRRSENSALLVPQEPFSEPPQDILVEDGPKTKSVTPPVTKQSVPLATCAVGTEQLETKTQSPRPAPEVIENHRPHTTVETSSDIGKYVFGDELANFRGFQSMNFFVNNFPLYALTSFSSLTSFIVSLTKKN